MLYKKSISSCYQNGFDIFLTSTVVVFVDCIEGDVEDEEAAVVVEGLYIMSLLLFDDEGIGDVIL